MAAFLQCILFMDKFKKHNRVNSWKTVALLINWWIYPNLPKMTELHPFLYSIVELTILTEHLNDPLRWSSIPSIQNFSRFKGHVDQVWRSTGEMKCIKRYLQKCHLSQTMVLVSSNRYVGRLQIPWIDSTEIFYRGAHISNKTAPYFQTSPPLASTAN